MNVRGYFVTGHSDRITMSCKLHISLHFFSLGMISEVDSIVPSFVVSFELLNVFNDVQ